MQHIAGDHDNHQACTNCRERGRTCTVPDRQRRSHAGSGQGDTLERLARLEARLQQADAGTRPTSTSPSLYFATHQASSAKTTQVQPAVSQVHDLLENRATSSTEDRTPSGLGAPSPPASSIDAAMPPPAMTRPGEQARLFPFEQAAVPVPPSRPSYQLSSASSVLPDPSDATTESGSATESPDEIRERSSILSNEIVSIFLARHHHLRSSLTDKVQEQLGISWCVAISHYPYREADYGSGRTKVIPIDMFQAWYSVGREKVEQQ